MAGTSKEPSPAIGTRGCAPRRGSSSTLISLGNAAAAGLIQPTANVDRQAGSRDSQPLPAVRTHWVEEDFRVSVCIHRGGTRHHCHHAWNCPLTEPSLDTTCGRTGALTVQEQLLPQWFSTWATPEITCRAFQSAKAVSHPWKLLWLTGLGGRVSQRFRCAAEAE